MAPVPPRELQNDSQRREKPIPHLMGPAILDQAIRQAIQSCWAMMPPDKKTTSAVSREIRRIVDRALRDLEDDSRAFGVAS